MRLRATMVVVSAVVVAACNGNVFDLEVGQCFDDPEDFSQVSNVEIVDCADPHDNEVYHVFDIDGDEFPGTATIEDTAVQGCLDAFDGFVGLAYADSRLDVSYLYPSEDTWSDGDREVVCSLYDLNGDKMTGTMEGSGV